MKHPLLPSRTPVSVDLATLLDSLGGVLELRREREVLHTVHDLALRMLDINRAALIVFFFPPVNTAAEGADGFMCQRYIVFYFTLPAIFLAS